MRSGLTKPQRSVLAYLQQCPGAWSPVREVAAAAGAPEQGVTRTAMSLVRKKLVERTRIDGKVHYRVPKS